ncbi:hypothetical protein P879_01085 [Paragonimus westermani]|uniref:Uncharacterized protein n=1 Tax=Paragonimus westermani TaxID=34504 RepID=A0A8T0DQ01_9TREM|nr:hypothetical protein P879_01085 [Paragonimus westermani]
MEGALASAVTLHYQQPDAPVTVVVGTSDKAVGVAMHASAKLKRNTAPSVANLSLYVGPYTIFATYSVAVTALFLRTTQPLLYASWSQSDRYSPRQTRWLDYTAQFSTDIRHISGAANAAWILHQEYTAYLQLTTRSHIAVQLQRNNLVARLSMILNAPAYVLSQCH